MKIITHLYALWCKRNSQAYINYLRKKGAHIGEGTTFINSKHASVDGGRIKYLTVGDNCVICSGVSIIMHDYSWYVLGNKFGNLYPSGGQPITIGNNIFIGAHTIVLGNTIIGDNVIIGAGSVVKGKLESDMVYGGNPAKPIMTLEEYKKRRSNRYIDDARKEVAYYKRRFGRLPLRSEMKNYEVLFTEKRERENKKAIGFSGDKYIELLANTTPKYMSYQEFLDDCLISDEIK